MQGNIVRDFELQETKNGTKMVQFTIGVNDYFKGEGQAYFFDWVAWGKTAERIHEFFSAGGKIALVGKATQTKKWTKDNGDVVRPKVVFWVQDWDFANAAPKKPSYSDSKKAWQEEQKAAQESFMKIPEGISEGLPFA